jgi:glycerol-3-phosphate dehydrogenase
MNKIRAACIDRAQADVQDCLVVGAGINGAVAAAALAGKGATVTVVDRGDFASFTSQESSNLAWGGIKYLETYEFGLVWKLCTSRNQLMRAYPNQVQEIRFFTSIEKGFRKPLALVYLGALLYWFLGRCQTKAPRWLSRATILREAPVINAAPLAGGLEYSDCCLVENDTRFAFGFIRQALAHGGNAINYMELVAAEWRNGRWSCTLLDRTTDTSIQICAKTLINAAGPFADKINRMLGIDGPFKHIFSKGAHIIVPQISAIHRVLAFFASDGRLFFMIPMGGCTCIGTTDTRTDNEVAESSADDIEFLLTNANALLTLDKPLTQDDVIAQRCGVRPLVVKKEEAASLGNAEWVTLSRKHEIDIHPERKMCSIYGGKLTDCLNVGEEIAGIVKTFGIDQLLSAGTRHGEPGEKERQRFASECEKLNVSAEQVSRLWRRYGLAAFQCLEKIRGDASMAEPVIGPFIRAELHVIADSEMVVHLEDFLRRRSRLALTVDRESLRTDPGLGDAAKILFGDQAAAELAEYFCTR